MNQAYILLERSLFINNLVCICGQIASNPGIRVDKLGGTYFTTSDHFFNQTLRICKTLTISGTMSWTREVPINLTMGQRKPFTKLYNGRSYL